MTQDLQSFLRTRTHIGEVKFGAALVASVAFHLVVIGAFIFWPRGEEKTETPAKVTWINLPAAAAGPSGGSNAMEEGKQGQRLRQVEEVAPKLPDTVKQSAKATPDANVFTDKSRPPAKGTNTNADSKGTAPVAAKGANPTSNPVKGAAGSGDGGSIGAGSAIPGLNASKGVEGGVGLVGGVDGDFPFVWYLQQVQGRITQNWQRLGSQGRVQVYFRIQKDGSLDRVRIESPSGNGALDESALMAVRRSSPLPKLPDGYTGDYLGVRFWFTYLGN
jgi:TonB family protein